MGEFSFAFWNLQNLFDSKSSEIASDLYYTPENGWTKQAVDKKIANLAEVIRTMFDGRGPDLLGICEVETPELVRMLAEAVGRDDYEIAHDDAQDLRGIDCSLIFSRDVFERAGESKGHIVHLRFATRDIFEVPLKVKENGKELIVFVNHWPSRRGSGAKHSEAFRITVASHAGRLIDRRLKVTRQRLLELPDVPASREELEAAWRRNILVLGDFNDDPFDRSVQEVLRASNSLDHLEEELLARSRNIPSNYSDYLAKQAYLYNYMWPILVRGGAGSIFFSGQGDSRTKQLFDQVIASRSLHYGLEGLQVVPDSVDVFTPKLMWTDSRLSEEGGAKNPHKVRPRGFDRRSGEGYSDHFPVVGQIQYV
jgi:hypothetical protein